MEIPFTFIHSKTELIFYSVLGLTFLCYAITHQMWYLFLGLFWAFAFYMYNKYSPEGFSSNKFAMPQKITHKQLKQEFHPVTKHNPFGNVLLTEINDNPDRKNAPPSFEPETADEITRAAKKTVQMLNPTLHNTNKVLFGDLKDMYDFDWFQRNFYSMPNTRVTSDQGAFAQFLYGGMKSCRDVNDPDSGFACVQDNERYILR